MTQGRKRFLWFSFEREAKWLIVLYVLIPLVLILLAIVIPGILRRWFPSPFDLAFNAATVSIS
jgi:hypothetical protein